MTQNILLKIAKKIQQSEYDPTQSFREWLTTVARNSLIDHFRDRSRRRTNEASDASYAGLESAEAKQDLMDRLQQSFDLEVLDEAMSRVSQRVSPQRWLAFKRTAIDGLSGADAAAWEESTAPRMKLLGEIWPSRCSTIDTMVAASISTDLSKRPKSVAIFNIPASFRFTTLVSQERVAPFLR